MKKKALTLIEVLAVVSIISIMSGIIMLNSENSQSTVGLTNQIAKIKQDFYSTREQALSGVQRDFNNDNYGVGIHFTNGNYYIIYVNKDDHMSYGSGDSVLKKVYLNDNFEYTIGNFYDILYIPPHGNVKLCSGDNCNGILLNVHVKNIQDITQTSDITINSSGVFQ